MLKPREVDIFHALRMFYDSEGDLFRLQSALRHLEIIEDIQRLNSGYLATPSGLDGGSGRTRREQLEQLIAIARAHGYVQSIPPMPPRNDKPEPVPSLQPKQKKRNF
jgi:hypothetical protein